MKSILNDFEQQLTQSTNIAANGPTELVGAALERVAGGRANECDTSGTGWIQRSSTGETVWSLNGGTPP